MRQGHRLSIPATVLIGMAVLATVSTSVLGLLWVRGEILHYGREIARHRSDYIEGRRNLIKTNVDNVIDYIIYMKSQEETRLRKEIRERVNEAHAVAENLVRKFGLTMPRETLESLVKEALREIWFHDGQGYYFAFRMDGIETLFAERPDLEGTDMMGIQDTEGRFVVRDLLNLAREKSEGYYAYRWIRPGREGADFRKISYVKYLEPLDWVIGTGIYVDDMVHTIQTEVLDRINSIRLPEDEYIFVGQWDGLSLVGPAAGRIMIDVEDVNGMKVVRELVSLAREDGGFIEYVMPDVDGQRVATKLSYTRGVPDWEWYVGTGVYIDEIERDIALLEAEQAEMIRADVAGIITILLVLLLASVVAALFTSRSVKKGVIAITEFFERATTSSLSSDTPPLAIPEFIQLADTANRILIERLKAEDERHKLEEKVQHTQRLESLGILAGGIAHDFNNLLQAILGNAELAKPALPPGSSVNENFAAIETASHRAADLCQQLLTYSGQGSFTTETVDMKTLVLEMSQMISVSVPKKTQIAYDFSDEPSLVEADAGQVRQVVLNVITNASEAIGDTQGTILLHIRRREVGVAEATQTDGLSEPLEPGQYVELLVVDDGDGMDQETLGRIFDPFYTTKFTGRGLGLAAVLGIVRRHHGAIKVESEVGIGTRFSLLLPASKKTEVRSEAVAPEPLRAARQGTILVVDDEPAILQIARQMLERSGYAVISASDGKQAVELFSEHKNEVVCVLMDFVMPKMDGIEALAAIHRIAPGLAFVLTSGYDEKDYIAKSPGYSPAGFMQKPFRMQELIDAVDSAVFGKAAPEQTDST